VKLTRRTVVEIKRKRWRHECPSCHRVVRWQLALCSLCSWRGYPLKNRMWVKEKP